MPVDQRNQTPVFHPDQIEAMHAAFARVCAAMRQRGNKAPTTIELVAIKVVDLARAGEFDPDRLTEGVLADFGRSGASPACLDRLSGMDAKLFRFYANRCVDLAGAVKNAAIRPDLLRLADAWLKVATNFELEKRLPAPSVGRNEGGGERVRKPR
jgi:hypothetical protein